MPHHESQRFSAAASGRMILVVDDEAINREILGMILSQEYRVLYAGDGEEALRLIRENREVLSLVLLDLLMPQVSGLEVLTRMKNDMDLKDIPVIVVTSDQEAEVESLGLGAIDFIPKPYPKAEVILARVLRTIELSEDRQTIRSTERDTLTGLYNKEFFFWNVEKYDRHHPDARMDAVLLGIYHFRLIIERYGRSFSDQVLKRIGERLLEIVREQGGLACRREGDVFLIYCPHYEDPRAFLARISEGITGDEAVHNRVHLMMGVYANVDKNLEVESRFGRARLAADTLRQGFTRNVAVYDRALHETEMFNDQLIEDFSEAIRRGQFRVVYQPKFDVRPETPVLCAAEALVRWQHPTLGMISPGIFIPLFEENGLIQALDSYVWHTAAAQISLWKQQLGVTLPVSVNVSRIDMYDPDLIRTFKDILVRNGLEPDDLRLEITESAYTEDSGQIIAVVNKLRELGFQIEMDDFGTGYSSLNMISSLPIDVLKLDMQFIRNAFRDGKDTRMLEIIIDIAEYLHVPVIAEGVETKEQYETLRLMGCDMIQGYYFSKPVSAEEVSRMLLRFKGSEAQDSPAVEQPRPSRRREALGRIAYALSAGYETLYYVDTETGYYLGFDATGRMEDLQVLSSGTDFFTDVQRDIPRLIYAEDRERIALSFRKESLMMQLVGDQAFTVTYRQMVNGQPVFYSLKAVRSGTGDNHHIVIGVSNIDEQVKQASVVALTGDTTADFSSLAQTFAQAKHLANRDALTGVKSKHVFNEAELDWNKRISDGEAEPFAIAMCDINGLKQTNDVRGHKAGDRLIQKASAIICNIFKHSPVYRIGGDEFVAVLRGDDYEKRSGLLEAISHSNRESAASGGVVVACGLAEWDGTPEDSFTSVFERADARMYENKHYLKEQEKPEDQP